jgi:hypothetical protein
MPNELTNDVFLSHRSKDKAVVRAIAERLWAEGLQVEPKVGVSRLTWVHERKVERMKNDI